MLADHYAPALGASLRPRATIWAWPWSIRAEVVQSGGYHRGYSVTRPYRRVLLPLRRERFLRVSAERYLRTAQRCARLATRGAWEFSRAERSVVLDGSVIRARLTAADGSVLELPGLETAAFPLA